MKENKPMCQAISDVSRDIYESIAYDMHHNCLTGWDTQDPSKSEYVEVIGALLYTNITKGHDSEMKDFYNSLGDAAREYLIGDSY